MIHTANLKIESLTYQELKSRLQAEFTAELDDETIADTLEGITDLHEMIAAVIRSALVDEALHAGLRFRLDDMRQRLSRLELRASKKRQLALEAMTEVGLSKLEQPDFTASARAALPRSWSSLRTGSPKPIGCRNRRSSIAKRSSASSSAAPRSPVRK